jgi:hypothetical protein
LYLWLTPFVTLVNFFVALIVLIWRNFYKKYLKSILLIWSQKLSTPKNGSVAKTSEVSEY